MESRENFLITGVAGFIGSHLAEALLSRHYRVLGIDAMTNFYPRSSKIANLAHLQAYPTFTFVEADLRHCDLDSILPGIDYIFHLAAQPGVSTSWGDNFASYVEHNILATQRLLEAARKHPVRRLVYASSSSVYGNARELPVRETSQL